MYMVFGHSWTVGYIANAILSATTVLLTYRMAREFLSSRLSLVSAGLIALLPSHISYTTYMSTETLHAVFVIVTLIVTRHVLRHPNWKSAVWLGFIIGLSVYVRPILLLLPAVVGLLLVIQKVRFTTAVTLASLAMVVSLATISPWTARNFLVMGELILTTTNGGKLFFIGNGPGAVGEHRDIMDDSFSAFSELDWHREGYKLGLENMIEHPRQWLSLLPKKVFHLWASDWSGVAYSTLPKGHPPNLVTFPMIVAQGYYMAIVIAAALAAISKPIRGYWLRSPAILLLITLVYWTAFHMMFHGEGRYHMQVIPLIAIIAGHLLAHDRDLISWLPSGWRRDKVPA